MSLPSSISYRNIPPIGVPSRIRKTTFYPHNVYSGNIRPNDVVKFHIKAPTFWDPYNCFVKMKVIFDEAEDGCVQQLDSSAHSFISEMIISAGNQEIERIQEYDTLAAMLMDNAHNNETRMAKQHEGLSSEILASNNWNFMSTQDNAAIFSDQHGSSENKALFCATHGFKPTINQVGSTVYHAPTGLTNDTFRATTTPANAPGADDDKNFDASAGGAAIPSHPRELGRLSNPVNIIEGSTSYHQIEKSLQRADQAFISSRRKGHPGFFRPIVKYPFSKTEADNLVNITWTPNKPMSVENSVKLSVYWSNNENKYEDVNDEIDPPTVGNLNVFSKEFASGCFEDTFSNNFKHYVFEYGRVSKPKIRLRNYAEYTVPLMSGVLGILMPRDNYKLFPAFAVDNLQIEFRVSPYAVFTSGYKKTVDPDYLDTTKKNTIPAAKHDVFQELKYQHQRKFRIKEFELIVDLIQFDDTITDLMRAQLANDGIILSTHSFALGPVYNIQNYSSVQGSHSINMGFESLKNIFLVYLSNDYQEYSFCRKQFRLSRNITFLQAKIGLDYYPEKALEGHAGNPYIYNSEDAKNNWVYIYELWRTFAHMNEIHQNTIINKHNFAIDERPYDVTNREPYYKTSNKHVENNVDTAMGYPLIHENRMVGRAIYVLNFSYNADKTSLNGINTIQNRPFDIIINNDKSSEAKPDPIKKDRPCSMITFLHFDMIVQISLSGVRVLGRA